MSGFYARYVGTLVVGVAAVWVGVPEIKRGLGTPEAARMPPPAGEAEPRAPVRFAPAVVRRPARPPDRPSETPAAEPERAQPTPAPEPVGVTPTVVSAPEPQPQPQGPVYDWGVLAETTNCYTAAGMPNGKLPGGTVVERMSVHESSRGTLLRCRVLHNQMWREGFFVPESAVVMFQGAYTAAPSQDRDKIVRYFTLRALIADRRADLRDRAVRANPHFAAYQAAAKALTEFQAKAKGLVAQRDAATGMARSRLDDELRRLKAEESKILYDFRKAEDPYKRWRSRNDDGSAAIAADAQINAWENELMAMEPTVRGMVGGL